MVNKVKKLINSIKPEPSSMPADYVTPKGAIGYDNTRDVIDRDIKTGSIKSNEGAIVTIAATTGNITTANVTTGNITTGNITTGNITTAVLGAATVTGDQASADTAYVPMILYNTDAVPPAASNFPIGTLYVQYTA